jgi:hypothetical protein
MSCFANLPEHEALILLKKETRHIVMIMSGRPKKDSASVIA